MKGISTIVAIILLLAISISLIASAALWSYSTTGKIFPEIEIQQKEVYLRTKACLIIDEVSGNNITVRNCGAVPLSEFTMYINDILVEATLPTSLQPMQSIQIELAEAPEGWQIIKVTSNYAKAMKAVTFALPILPLFSLTLAARPESVDLGAAVKSSLISVEVKNFTTGEPIPDLRINFTTDLGVLTLRQVITDADGKASTTLSSTDPGTSTVIAFNDTTSNATEVKFVPAGTDTIRPAKITDLATSEATGSSIKLTWTAPGDDENIGTASQYDIRYYTSQITDANWGSATQVSGESLPSPAGSAESFIVSGLGEAKTYWFAIKTADEIGWSELSNSPSGTTIDVTPPTISGIFISSITTSSATISWNTNEPATSQVEYGTTTAYGSSTTKDTNLVTPHSQTLSGLSAGATYHFRVKSTDAAGLEAISGDNTFTTIPLTVSSASPTGSCVSLPTTITITFTGSMNKANTEGAFSISPLVGGTKSWSDDKTMTFTPSSLSYNTPYTVTIGTGATDTAGNPLQSAYSWSFTTDMETVTLTIGKTLVSGTTYNQHIVIGADSITLNCNGATLDGPGCGVGVYLNGRTEATVKGCTIKNFGNNIRVDSSSTNTIQSNDVSSSYGDNIYLGSSSNNNVIGNTIHDIATWGKGINLVSSSNYNTIKQNYIYSNTYGIYLESSSYNKIIDNNNIYSNRLGLEMWSSSSFNNISDNTFDSNPINNLESSHNIISYNTLKNGPSGTGGPMGCEYPSSIIFLRGSSNISIHHNTFSNNANDIACYPCDGRYGSTNVKICSNSPSLTCSCPCNDCSNPDCEASPTVSSISITEWGQSVTAATVGSTSTKFSVTAKSPKGITGCNFYVKVGADWVNQGAMSLSCDTWSKWYTPTLEEFYAGSFEAKVTCTDEAGRTATKTQTITVKCRDSIGGQITKDTAFCPGTYSYSETLHWPICIAASGITIDCNGAILNGPGSGNAIKLGPPGCSGMCCAGTSISGSITIANCTIKNFDTAIDAENSGSNIFKNNNISLNNRGIALEGDYASSCIIRNNRIFSNNYGIDMRMVQGIGAAHSTTIENNYVCSNSYYDIVCGNVDHSGTGNKADKVYPSGCGSVSYIPCTWCGTADYDSNIYGDGSLFTSYNQDKTAFEYQWADVWERCVKYQPTSSHKLTRFEFYIEGSGTTYNRLRADDAGKPKTGSAGELVACSFTLGSRSWQGCTFLYACDLVAGQTYWICLEPTSVPEIDGYATSGTNYCAYTLYPDGGAIANDYYCKFPYPWMIKFYAP